MHSACIQFCSSDAQQKNTVSMKQNVISNRYMNICCDIIYIKVLEERLQFTDRKTGSLILIASNMLTLSGYRFLLETGEQLIECINNT